MVIRSLHTYLVSKHTDGEDDADIQHLSNSQFGSHWGWAVQGNPDPQTWEEGNQEELCRLTSLSSERGKLLRKPLVMCTFFLRE